MSWIVDGFTSGRIPAEAKTWQEEQSRAAFQSGKLLFLRQFCQDFSAETGIPVEPVYTGKMFYALHKLALAGHFQPGEQVVALHTGGLQGARGFL